MMVYDDIFVMIFNCLYLLWVIYDWIIDNNLMLYIFVDVVCEGVCVLLQVIKNGQVVFNLVMCVVVNFDLGNEWISFQVCFFGVSQFILILVLVVFVLYVQENGQGMMFFVEEGDGGDVLLLFIDGGELFGGVEGGVDGDWFKWGVLYLCVVK